MIVRLLKTVLILTMVFTTTVTNMSTIQESEQIPAEDVTVSEFSDETVLAGDISEHVTLRWYLDGSNVIDDEQVMERVNEYLNEKLNMTLVPIWGTWGDFDTNAVLALEYGDAVDIYFTSSWSGNEYNTYAKEGYWVRLDNPENNLLEKYGQELFSTLPEGVFQGAVINGYEGMGIYAVPNMGYCTEQYGWAVNVELLEKYGYSLADIEGYSYSELSDVLHTVKKGEGKDFYPILLKSADNHVYLETLATNSFTVPGDDYGQPILAYYADPYDIENSGEYGNNLVNRYATTEYKDLVRQSEKYAEDGIINPNIMMLTQGELDEIDRRGEWLMQPVMVTTPDYKEIHNGQYDIEVAFVPVVEQHISTERVQNSLMAISKTSANPERAMMFLNLLNTDSQLRTLLACGIEGVHYDITAEGLLQYKDMRADYMPWGNGMGNITLSPIEVGEGDKNYWEEVYWPYINAAKATPILGFTLDLSAMEYQQLSDLADVTTQYAGMMSAGFMDVKTELQNFNAALDDAGIDEYVEEAQKQLDEFLAYK